MTNQEAFDKMMNHLRSLKVRSMSEGGSCVYNGSKCPVGFLMTDEEQEKWGTFEGDVHELLEDMSRKGHKSLLHDLDPDFLENVQILHDQRWRWDERGFVGEESAKKTAEHFGLTYTNP